MNLIKCIEDLKNDYESGSTQIIKKAAGIFFDFFRNGNPDKKTMMRIIPQIAGAKPTMPGISNVLNNACGRINETDIEIETIREEVLADLSRAGETVLNKAYKEIFENNDIFKILSCSYSSTVEKLIRYAAGQGKIINLTAARSVWKGNDYGTKLLEKCQRYVSSTNLVDPNAPTGNSGDFDFMLTGADAFTKKGDVVNGIPTLELARSIGEGLPYYVLAESFKRTDSVIVDDGFELVPAEYVTRIFSDDIFGI